jgi:hypothetical protein
VATVPTATPKMPIGRYRIRNAYESHATAPSSAEAKLVPTKMFTCTAASPTVAGAISERMARRSGSEGPHSGRNRQPAFHKPGSWMPNCAAPPSSVPAAQPSATCAGEKPAAHSTAAQAMVTRLKTAGAKAGVA